MKDYEIKFSTTDEEFTERLLLAYATGLSSLNLDLFNDKGLKKHAKNFIQGIILYNEELNKVIQKK